MRGFKWLILFSSATAPCVALPPASLQSSPQLSRQLLLRCSTSCILAVVQQEREQARFSICLCSLRRFLLNQIDQATGQHHFYLVLRHPMLGLIGLVLGQIDHLDAISLTNGITHIGN